MLADRKWLPVQHVQRNAQDAKAPLPQEEMIRPDNTPDMLPSSLGQTIVQAP
jgi:hypothetical protein